jgi:hypothetical protein
LSAASLAERTGNSTKRNIKYYGRGSAMKTMNRAALIAATCVFLLPLAAQAEIRAGSVELSPFVGYV